MWCRATAREARSVLTRKPYELRRCRRTSPPPSPNRPVARSARLAGSGVVVVVVGVQAPVPKPLMIVPLWFTQSEQSVPFTFCRCTTAPPGPLNVPVKLKVSVLSGGGAKPPLMPLFEVAHRSAVNPARLQLFALPKEKEAPDGGVTDAPV